MVDASESSVGNAAVLEECSHARIEVDRLAEVHKRVREAAESVEGEAPVVERDGQFGVNREGAVVVP